MPDVKPRLLIVLPHVTLGGGETATLGLAAGLAHHFTLTLCALDYLPPTGGLTVGAELAARFDRVHLLRHRWQLRPLLAAADAVLFYGTTPAVPKTLATLPQRPASIRVVHTERPEDGAIYQRRWGRWIDAVVAVSPAAAQRIPGAVFLPNTVDETRLRGTSRRFFPPGSGPVLGFLGRLVPPKNVPWLVKHCAAVGAYLLLQALDTPFLQAAALARLAEDLGVADRVRFLPPGREVGTLLRSIDALVVASQTEGFPMVVIEAGAVGTPVIATPVGALPTLFPDEILFLDLDGDQPCPDSLRTALARLDPRYGIRLQRRVANLCGHEVVVDRYRSLIHYALAQHRGVAKPSSSALQCASSAP